MVRGTFVKKKVTENDVCVEPLRLRVLWALWKLPFLKTPMCVGTLRLRVCSAEACRVFAHISVHLCMWLDARASWSALEIALANWVLTSNFPVGLRVSSAEGSPSSSTNWSFRRLCGRQFLMKNALCVALHGLRVGPAQATASQKRSARRAAYAPLRLCASHRF